MVKDLKELNKLEENKNLYKKLYDTLPERADLMKKVLGVIGGMGPLATVKLFDKIVQYTDAKCDQEHLRIIIDNNTLIPDRSAHILADGEDPREQLINSATRLQSSGAEFLIMPCNTAHYFLDDIVKNIDIPFINMIEETARYIKVNHRDVIKVGLLATEGTHKAMVYENVFSKYGLTVISPSEEKQRYIMDIIYAIKKGIKLENLDDFYKVIEEVESKDVDLFILGCTELSVALELYSLKGSYIDAMDILAKKAIEFSGAKVKKY